MKSCLRCLALCTMALAIAGCPSRSDTVFGVVADVAGAPICGALVVLEGEGETRRTYTGEEGDFRFSLVVPGDHTVQVIGAIGYAPSEAFPVTIVDPGSGSGRPPRLVITLAPGESVGGEICNPDEGGCTGAKESLGRALSRQLGDLAAFGLIVVVFHGAHTALRKPGE